MYRTLSFWMIFMSTYFALPSSASLHGEPIPPVNAEMRAHIKPPLQGQREFMNALRRDATQVFSARELENFSGVLEAMRFAEELSAGSDAHEITSDAEYYRWESERRLLELLDHTAGVVHYNLKAGQGWDPRDWRKIAGRETTLLLCIDDGDATPRLILDRRNLEHNPETVPALPFKYAPGARTYVLLYLEELGSGRSQVNLAFTPEGGTSPSHVDAMQFDCGPLGRVALSILDENGKPTPALVRLTHGVSGQIAGPGNALDYREQAEKISGHVYGGPDLSFPLHSTGANRGLYWVMPGPDEFQLAPGPWTLRVVHGFEYEPLETSFTVTTETTCQVKAKLKRWISMPSLGWFSGDDHVHARMMNNHDAALMLTFAEAMDTHVLNILEMGNHERTWYAQRGFGPAYRVQTGNHALVPGQEDPRYRLGHAIGLNLRGLARDLDHYLLNDWVADEIHRQGGLYGHTHVGHKAFGIERDMTLLIPRGKSDFSSILQNFLSTELYFDFLDLGYKLTASAGSDTPYGTLPGSVRLYAQTGETVLDVDAWFAGLKAGRTFVTNGPMLDFSIDGHLPGETLSSDGDATYTLNVKASGISGQTAPARIEVIALGRVIATKNNSDRDGTCELTMSIDTEYGKWVTAHVQAEDRTEAVATPIYLERRGYRHWNVERARELIAERLRTLTDLETELRGLEAEGAANAFWPHDRFKRIAVEQAPQLRERIADSRKHYEDLIPTLEAELKHRVK